MSAKILQMLDAPPGLYVYFGSKPNTRPDKYRVVCLGLVEDKDENGATVTEIRPFIAGTPLLDATTDRNYGFVDFEQPGDGIWQQLILRNAAQYHEAGNSGTNHRNRNKEE